MANELKLPDFAKSSSLFSEIMRILTLRHLHVKLAMIWKIQER